MKYDGPLAFQGGISNMQSFARDIRDYMEQNFEKESWVERVKIEGRGQGSRLMIITFPDSGLITAQHVRMHDDIEEERLKKELLNLYEKHHYRQVSLS